MVFCKPVVLRLRVDDEHCMLVYYVMQDLSLFAISTNVLRIFVFKLLYTFKHILYFVFGVYYFCILYFYNYVLQFARQHLAL